MYIYLRPQIKARISLAAMHRCKWCVDKMSENFRYQFIIMFCDIKDKSSLFHLNQASRDVSLYFDDPFPNFYKMLYIHHSFIFDDNNMAMHGRSSASREYFFNIAQLYVIIFLNNKLLH